MNLYYFNPNGYGEQAFVMAESKDDAIRILKQVLEKRMSNMDEYSKKYSIAKIDDMVNCNDGYTIDELEYGKVLFSEIS